jgi:hypothetical protein
MTISEGENHGLASYLICPVLNPGMIVEPAGHDQLVGDAKVNERAVGKELDVSIGGGCAR